MTGRIWVITSFFNPARYVTKRRNYDRFLAGLTAAGVPCLTVECAFDDQPFELPPSASVLRVRSRDVLWQKERMLNVALRALPAECTAVAWVDCDVLFDSPEWARETEALLQRYAVLQPFASVVRLPRGALHDDGRGKRWQSFGAVYQRDPGAAASGEFDPHGHTGFAWAARRDILEEVGLYDVCIAGSADHLMAHVFARQFENPCVDRIVGKMGPYREHFLRWARRADAVVQGSLTAGTGMLRHLWHGALTNRKYVERNAQLARSSFDPARHLAVGASGLWEWRGDTDDLRAWMIDYFASRKEDSDEAGAAG
jgi:hypothetical protein